jgi:hypothetical protein
MGAVMTRKFLPALDSTLQPPAPNGEESWSEHEGGLTVLSKYSRALSVSHREVPAERLKSVPSPWARLLLFEQALYNRQHPSHVGVTSEWRGLLGAIGIAPHLGLEVAPKSIDLRTGTGVIPILREMAPRGERAELWNHHVLIYFDGQLVGGTSPRTLVFSGIRPVTPARVPFVRDGRLVDPAVHYQEQRDRSSLALVVEWLSETIRRFEAQDGLQSLQGLLGNLPSSAVEPITGSTNASRTQTPATSRAALLLGALKEWKESAERAAQEIGRPAGRVVGDVRTTTLASAYPQSHPAGDVFRVLPVVYPAEGLATENDLQLAAGSGVVDPGADGVLEREGNRFTGTVVLPRGMSREVRGGRFTQQTAGTAVGATLPDLGALFERKLVPVHGVTAQARALEVNGVRYLYPFRQEILQHLDPQLLESWTEIAGARATGITVRLRIPLASGLQLMHERTYVGGDVFDEQQVTAPLVSVWPDFESEAWTHYFHVSRETGRAGLLLEPWSREAPAARHEAQEAGLRWSKLTAPARAWVGTFNGFQGILLSRAARRQQPTDERWDISIDFGSTNTRVFRAALGAGGATNLTPIPLKPRTVSLIGPDTSIPYNFFVSPDTVRGSADEPPSLVWLPLDRTIDRGATPWLPADGVIFWAAVEDAPTTSGLRGNLKWHRDDRHERAAFHSYASQLYLSIAAEAAAAGATVASVITAYPSVLPVQLRTRHRHEWGELAPRFQVTVKPPRSESDAIASYFRHRGATPDTNLLAVDVGGSTSDLSLWLAGQKAHGDSVRLAGDILSRLVATSAAARGAIDTALSRPPFNRRPVPWDEHDPSKNGMILNSVLRTVSQDARLRSHPDALARNLYDGQGSSGEWVIAHLAYLFATVSFLLGLMTRRSGVTQDRYDIRFAGKGSQFLFWLEALNTGSSLSLPASFFRAGLGSDNPDIVVDVSLPNDEVKQEVGRGLLLPDFSEQPPGDERLTFVGETGFGSNENLLDWRSPLDFETLRRFAAPTQPVPLDRLENLQSFVKAFDVDAAARKAARALRLAPALNLSLRDLIHSELFGTHSVWRAARDDKAHRSGDALLEPFFVVEAKALLKEATDNRSLFE